MVSYSVRSRGRLRAPCDDAARSARPVGHWMRGPVSASVALPASVRHVYGGTGEFALVEHVQQSRRQVAVAK